MIWIGLALGAPLGLSHGDEAIGEDWVSVSDCAGCHEAETRDWRTSRHAAAHTNPLYRQGLRDEPSKFCVNCHSPLQAQVDEVVLTDLDRDTPRADEGVGCAACHVRRGEVISPAGGGFPGHADRAEPIDRPDFCGGCHEFKIPHFEEGSWTSTEVFMQSTASEHRAWGGEESCVDCHMPGGRHVFRGAYDPAFLRGALQVEDRGGRLVLRSVGVGHAFPTGDLFRHLTVEAKNEDGWEVVEWIGRRFGVDVDPATFATRKVVREDRSLQPGVPREVWVGDRPWRVVYHYGSAADEARGFPDEVLYLVLATDQT